MNFADIHTHNVHAGHDAVICIEPDDAMPAGDNLHFSCGVHPWRSSEAEALWPMVVARATDPRVVAIGECGIDRLRGADVQLQTELFRSHALLAEEVGKPLIIHCVRGWAELLAVHRAVAPAVTWIVHGFRGAPAIFSGFQLPKIITASARKPNPATSPVAAQFAVVKAYTNPPMPASAPEIVVPA